jgi:hypothetical protein
MKKTLLITKLFLLSFTVQAEVIKGLNIDQKWDCKVAKVYSKPTDSMNGKPIDVKIGTRLLVEADSSKKVNPSIRDLWYDSPFYVGKYNDWFYEELTRGGPRFEKACKTTCLIFSTPRGGRWVFHPQRNGTMKAFFDYAAHWDLRNGKRVLGFTCKKTRK